FPALGRRLFSFLPCTANHTGYPIEDERRNQHAAKPRRPAPFGEVASPKLAEPHDPVRNLTRRSQEHQPSQPMEAERFGNVAGSEGDEATGEAATGALDAKQRSTPAQRWQRIEWQPRGA